MFGLYPPIPPPAAAPPNRVDILEETIWYLAKQSDPYKNYKFKRRSWLWLANLKCWVHKHAQLGQLTIRKAQVEECHAAYVAGRTWSLEEESAEPKDDNCSYCDGTGMGVLMPTCFKCDGSGKKKGD